MAKWGPGATNSRKFGNPQSYDPVYLLTAAATSMEWDDDYEDDDEKEEEEKEEEKEKNSSSSVRATGLY